MIKNFGAGWSAGEEGEPILEIESSPHEFAALCMCAAIGHEAIRLLLEKDSEVNALATQLIDELGFENFKTMVARSMEFVVDIEIVLTDMILKIEEDDDEEAAEGALGEMLNAAAEKEKAEKDGKIQ
jgi:hypothetical protein